MAVPTKTPPFLQALIATVLLVCSATLLIGGCYVMYLTGTKPLPPTKYIYEAKDVRRRGS